MPTNVLGPTGRPVAGLPPEARAGAIPFARLATAATVAALVAVIGDLLVYFVAALWGVPGEYAPLFNPLMIVATALLGVVVAAIGLAVLTRATHRAGAIFRVGAVMLTLLSLAGPLQALAGAMPGFAAATTATGITMTAMHLITGAAIAGLLPALARR